VSIRAALALLPKKTMAAGTPVYTPPGNATPTPDGPNQPLPSLQAILMSHFRGVDVVINNSSTPGRWHLNLDVEDATTDQVRGIALILSGKKLSPDLLLPASVQNPPSSG